MAKAIKSFILLFFTSFFEDFLILAGLAMMAVNTYLITVVDINILTGNYFVGIILLIIGVVLAKR